MKLKNVLAALGIASVFMLAACDDKDPAPTPTPTPTQTSAIIPTKSANEEDYLSFLTQKKGRIDLFNIEGVTFKYGDDTVVSGQTFDVSSTKKLTISGTPNADLNFIIVTRELNVNVIVCGKAIDKEQVSEYLANIASDVYNGSDKFYIAISAGEVKWTRNLSTTLDTKIPPYLEI